MFVSFGPAMHRGPSAVDGTGSFAHMLPGGCVPSVTNSPATATHAPPPIPLYPLGARVKLEVVTREALLGERLARRAQPVRVAAAVVVLDRERHLGDPALIFHCVPVLHRRQHACR